MPTEADLGASFDLLDASLNGEAKGSVQIKAALQASMRSRSAALVSPSHALSRPLTPSAPLTSLLPHTVSTLPQAMLSAFDTKLATDTKLRDESKRRRQGALDAQANIQRVATDFVRMEEERAVARAAKAEAEAKAAEVAKVAAEKVKKEAADKAKKADAIPAFMMDSKAPAAAAPVAASPAAAAGAAATAAPASAAPVAAEEDPLLAKLAVLDGTASSPAPAAAPVELS